ncbi:MAG TPA: hypothetical protein VL069_09300 [Opitutus sp.]|nr:hypothetical protein [Opitutus sp.]
MTTELAAQLTKLTKRQKLDLADRLLGEAGAHAKPATLRSASDPALEFELHRRLGEKARGTWLSTSKLQARIAR